MLVHSVPERLNYRSLVHIRESRGEFFNVLHEISNAAVPLDWLTQLRLQPILKIDWETIVEEGFEHGLQCPDLLVVHDITGDKYRFTDQVNVD